MANKKISELPTATSLDGTELYEIVQGGVNKKVSQSVSNPYRGDYAGGTSFPETGGRLSGGIPAAGDKWRLTSTLTIGGADVYEAGTIIESAIDTPGQTTGNWIKYAVQL